MKQTHYSSLSATNLRAFGLNPDQWLLIETSTTQKALKKDQVQFCHIDETDFRINATIKQSLKNNIPKIEIQQIEVVL